MKIEHISTTAAGDHAFAFSAGGQRAVFSVPSDFAGTGHVLAFGGDFWPGVYAAYFASALPEDDYCREYAFRVRLTTLGVCACRAALWRAALHEARERRLAAKPRPCQCGICRGELGLVAA